MLQKKELVVKSNQFIEAGYRLTLTEQRIMLYGICRAREEQKGLADGSPLTITAEDFASQFTEVDKNVIYRQLKEALDRLYERSIVYYDIDDVTGHVRANKVRWVSKASYVDRAGNIQIIFSQDLIKHITRLNKSQFTRYHLEKIGQMTSVHAIRLYEILFQFKKTGRRSLDLNWLRQRFQLADIEYKLTANFREKVIDVAVGQINEYSDIHVSYVAKKTGRAITSFDFKIQSKDKANKESAKEQQVNVDKFGADPTLEF